MSGRMRNAPGLFLALAIATAGLRPTVAEANPFSSWSDFTDWEHSTLTKAHLNSWSNFTNWEHTTATKAHLNSWSDLTNALHLSNSDKKANASARAARLNRVPTIDVPRAGSPSTTATALHRRVEAQVLEPPAAVSSSGNPSGATTTTTATTPSTSSGTGQFEAQAFAVPEPSALWVLAAGALAFALRGYRPGRDAGGRSRR